MTANLASPIAPAQSDRYARWLTSDSRERLLANKYAFLRLVVPTKRGSVATMYYVERILHPESGCLLGYKLHKECDRTARIVRTYTIDATFDLCDPQYWTCDCFDAKWHAKRGIKHVCKHAKGLHASLAKINLVAI